MSVDYLSPLSPTYDGVQAMPSGACTISWLRSSFEGQALDVRAEVTVVPGSDQGENGEGGTAGKKGDAIGSSRPRVVQSQRLHPSWRLWTQKMMLLLHLVHLRR